jgi:hypothetical protein
VDLVRGGRVDEFVFELAPPVLAGEHAPLEFIAFVEGGGDGVGVVDVPGASQCVAVGAVEPLELVAEVPEPLVASGALRGLSEA